MIPLILPLRRLSTRVPILLAHRTASHLPLPRLGATEALIQGVVASGLEEIPIEKLTNDLGAVKLEISSEIAHCHPINTGGSVVSLSLIHI